MSVPNSIIYDTVRGELKKSRKYLFERLTQLSRTRAYKREGVVEDRGAPKSPQEELELLASVIEDDLTLQAMLLIVDQPQRRMAYEQITPRLRFRARSFEEVMSL